MNVRACVALIGAVFALGGCASNKLSTSSSSPDFQPLVLEQTVELPNVKGGFDLMAADVAGRRLFVAGQDNNSVEVIDLKAGKSLHSIPGLHQPKGVVYQPERHKLYVANKDNGVVSLFDAQSYQPTGSVDFGSKANNLRYDARTKRVYVGYGDGAIGIIDATTDTRGPDIPLANYPKQFRFERRGERMFVNVPVSNHVAVINLKQNRVTDTWPVTEAKENVPMDLDEAHGRLLIGCDPGKFVVLDTKDGRSVASLPIHEGADGVQYDARRGRVYVTCGAGVIEVIGQADADHYRSVASVATEDGAGTSLFVPELDRLYVAVPQGKGRPAQVRVYRPDGAVR